MRKKTLKIRSRFYRKHAEKMGLTLHSQLGCYSVEDRNGGLIEAFDNRDAAERLISKLVLKEIVRFHKEVRAEVARTLEEVRS